MIATYFISPTNTGRELPDYPVVWEGGGITLIIIQPPVFMYINIYLETIDVYMCSHKCIKIYISNVLDYDKCLWVSWSANKN